MPIWSARLDSRVLAVSARRSVGHEPLALDIDRQDARVAISAAGEHLRLSSHGGAIRLDVVSGTVLDGPVLLRPILCLGSALEDQLTAVRRLNAFLTGSRPPVENDRRLKRLVLVLRVLDACREGASLRDIARDLFGERDWPGDGECIKSRVRRLVALSEAMVQAGPAGVLRRSV